MVPFSNFIQTIITCRIIQELYREDIQVPSVTRPFIPGEYSEIVSRY